MAESTEHIVAVGFESGALAREADTVQGNATLNSTSPIAGTYDAKLDWAEVISGTPPLDHNIICQIAWTFNKTFKNSSMVFKFKLNGTPGLDVIVANIGTLCLRINTSKQLYLNWGGGSSATSSALSTGTIYRIEILADTTINQRAYLRIDGVDIGNTTYISSGDSSFAVGESRKSSFDFTDPAFTANVDDVAFWYSESATSAMPEWWGATSTHYRFENAAGNYNSFTGTGDATNKYNNVDDYATDTDYNQGGTPRTNVYQSHNLTDATVSDTIKGFCVFQRYTNATSTNAVATSYILIRDNSVDYTRTLITSGADTKKVAYYGYEKRPDGTSLDNTSLNAIDVGSKVYQDDIVYSLFFGAIVQGYTQSSVGNADGTDDGGWTQTGGTPGSEYTVLNDSNSSTYIDNTSAGARQSFKVATPTITNGDIVSIILIPSIAGVTDASATVKGYFKTGGTRYYTNTVNVAGGTGQILLNEWTTNPATGNVWAASEVSSGEWGMEIVSMGTSGTVRWYDCLVGLGVRSDHREYSIWTVTAYGDAFSIPPLRSKRLSVLQAVKRSNFY